MQKSRILVACSTIDDGVETLHALSMRDHVQIIRAAGRPHEVALALGVHKNTVRSWLYDRKVIPPNHWTTIVRKGWATFEELAGISQNAETPA